MYGTNIVSLQKYRNQKRMEFMKKQLFNPGFLSSAVIMTLSVGTTLGLLAITGLFIRTLILH